MRVRGYSEDEAVNCKLQMQVHREVKKLKGIASASVSAVLSAAAVMVALSTTVTTTALATILPEDNDGSPVLSLPSPPKKTRKMSHQRQVNRQNKWKAKEAYAQALTQATTLIAAERGKEKENTSPTLMIIEQVKGQFRAHGFEVSLTKPTVNLVATRKKSRYVCR
jgi:hypothetical protein